MLGAQSLILFFVGFLLSTGDAHNCTGDSTFRGTCLDITKATCNTGFFMTELCTKLGPNVNAPTLYIADI